MAEQSKPTTADRRTLLRTTAIGVAAAGIGVTAAACSSNNSVAQGSNATTAQPADPGAATSSSGTSAGSSTIATTAEVPVKGGFVNSSAKVVVTQPSAGEYKAFSAVCTHAGCTVNAPSNNVIQCPCHFSQYDAATGEVIQGPATQALTPKNIKVSGSNIVAEA